MKIEDINKEDTFSCIYLWRNLVNYKVYVGQAQNFYRRMTEYIKGNEDERLIGRAINKYGLDNFEIVILEKDLPFEKLAEREMYWIKQYNSCIYFENGWGYNATEGGEGSVGFKHTNETKRKLSELRKESGFPIVCVETGKVYKNAVVATEAVGGKSVSGIRECLNGNNMTAYGYHWRYLKDDNWQLRKNRCNKAVVCVETNDIYESIREASRQTGINKCSIAECCRGTQKTAGGYHWKFKKDSKWIMPTPAKSGNYKTVRWIEGNIIYPTVKEASQQLNISMDSIIRCCKGKVKSVKQHSFEYVS